MTAFFALSRSKLIPLCCSPCSAEESSPCTPSFRGEALGVLLPPEDTVCGMGVFLPPTPSAWTTPPKNKLATATLATPILNLRIE